MRHTRLLITALVSISALLAGPIAGASAKSQKVAKLSCTLELFAQGMPNPSGIHFGFATCPRPFGMGVQYNSYTVTPTGPGKGTVAGTFKNFYSRGTASGTFALTFAATNPMNLTYTGSVAYTGGTAAFRGVRGSGTIHCTTTDGGAHKACTVNSTLKGL